MSAQPLELVVTNGQVQLVTCSLYKTGGLVPILDRHHIAPESWWKAAGKDPNLTPFADLCPDCHRSTHVAIDGILRGLDLSLLPDRCVALAHQAFTIAEANGLTPKPTL